MSQKIIFNWFPPASSRWPSPSGSILKSFLSLHSFSMDVKYWNIAFEPFLNQFLGMEADKLEESVLGLLPFLNYVSIRQNDTYTMDDIKYLLLSNHPNWQDIGVGFAEEQMLKQADRMDEIIASELQKMNLDQYMLFGVATKLNQWLPANIIAEKVRDQHPMLPIVAGGFNTKEEALAIMDNFEFYDYAIWGEGEYPLLELSRALTEGKEVGTVPYLVYRDENRLPIASTNRKKSFLVLDDDLNPDFSDFFTQNKKPLKDINLPIEGSRGCHWQHCKFCYLNDGYRYRVKNATRKITEIKELVENYNVSSILFLDNDIIGKDLPKFNEFLDQLIQLREEHNDFKIMLGEIITNGISRDVVKKMALSGFTSVQIGYESPSNELLKKINKKNTFPSNLLFIKWAKHFSIRVVGLNVLMGLFEETREDIMEGIDNLRYFLMRGYFSHNISTLAITQSSRYYRELNQEQLHEWNKNSIYEFLPRSYIKVKDIFNVFQFTKQAYNPLWEHFRKIEDYYLNNSHDYELIRHSNTIYYREYCNKNLINELELNNPLHWRILQQSNHQVMSMQDLQEKNDEPIDEIKSAIDSLQDEGLLYRSGNYDEIVSIVNTDLVL